MSMLPIENHPVFIANIHKLLKSDGFALLRIHVFAPPVFDSSQQVFEWYRREKSDTSIYSATRSYLYSLWLNPDTLTLNKIEYMNKVKELYQKGIITNEEYKEMDCRKNFNISIEYTTKEIFEQLIYPYFKIIDVNYAGDYLLHTNHPVYFLQKK